MLHDLYDTDLDLARGISALSTTTAGDQGRRCERGRYTAFHPYFHHVAFFYLYNTIWGSRFRVGPEDVLSLDCE